MERHSHLEYLIFKRWYEIVNDIKPHKEVVKEKIEKSKTRYRSMMSSNAVHTPAPGK